MSLTLTPENKNSVAQSLETKDTGRTWGESNGTWANEEGTWANPGTPVTKEAKNSTALSLETKP